MRAALYARFSNDDLQNQRSAQDQLAMLRQLAAARGWTIAAEFADEGISGAAIGNRQGVQDLMRRAAAGDFDVVYAEALDRLSRGQSDTARLFEMLTFHGVRLETVGSGVITEIHAGLEGTMNRLFLVELGKKTRRGLVARVKSGFSGGGRCYGYAVVDKGVLAIDEAQAAVVRRIFRDYAIGRSPRAIAHALNAEGVAGPRGAEWTASSINGDRRAQDGILHQELYVGVRVFNRRRFRKHPETGRRSSVLNPPDQWIREACPDLRILDDDAWSAVQSKKAELAAQSPNGPRARPKRLLSGLVSCASCHSPMVLQHDRLVCSRRRERGTCDNAVHAKASAVEERVIEGFKAHLMNPAYVERYLTDMQAEMQADQLAIRARLAANVREVAEIERRTQRAWEAYDEGHLSKAAFGDRMRELEARKMELQAEIDEAAKANTVVTPHPMAAKMYADLVADLHEALQGPDADEAREAFRALVHQVLIGQGEKRGAFSVFVTAKTPALFEVSKRAGGLGDLSESVLRGVGAGTRSDRHEYKPLEFAA